MNDEDEIASNTQALYDLPIAERKTGIMDLPPEIRAIFIRAVLGDRKVHAHYPENVGHPMLKDRNSHRLTHSTGQERRPRPTILLL